MFLKPDEAETESGDLLEAYRDSIHPLRGRWRADLWFVRQVAGYILRTGAVNLRNGVLAGLTLCVLTTAFSVLRYPSLLAGPQEPKFLVWIVVGVLLYGCVAVRWTHPATPEDTLILRLGTRWGIAIGAVWIASLTSANLVIPHAFWAGIGFLLAFVAFALQFVPGAHLAIKTGKLRSGLRAGFWSGLISGLMVFLALAAIGYLCAFVPGLPGAEIPSANHAYTAAEFERLNVTDALGGAFAFLFAGCPVFGVIGGTVVGWAGIRLERTGHSH